MQLTIEQLAAACGAHRSRAASMFPGLNEALAEFHIDTPARAGMFLANVGHETCRLLYLSELWGPTPQQKRYERDFKQPWPTTREESRDPAFAANRLAYNLGNDAVGDGKRYAGHGFLQNTGKTNHRLATERLRARLPHLAVPDFVVAPSQLATTQWGWMAAGEYVERNGCLKAADEGDFDAFCDLINLGRNTARVGDSNGYPERLGLWAGIQTTGVLA